MLTLELPYYILEVPNDAYMTLSQNLIGPSALIQEYCKLIGWLEGNYEHVHALLDCCRLLICHLDLFTFDYKLILIVCLACVSNYPCPPSRSGDMNDMTFRSFLSVYAMSIFFICHDCY